MKTIRLIIAATTLFIFSIPSFSQRSCASQEKLQEQLKNDPAFAKRFQENERKVQDYVAKNPHQQNHTSITIPIVIHVVYNTPEQNISDAQIYSQVDVLNEDFGATNSDYNNYDAGYGSVKGDMSIQYCVSQIVRVQTKKKSFTWNDGVKKTKTGGDDAIDPEHTLNIWVCNLGQGLLGYAQFPGGAPATFGVVCHYRAFGRGNQYNLYSAYNLGRTMTHEIGHCLGLRHIWGDTRCGNDLVDDTPLQNEANYGCPGEGHLSTCTGTPLEMWMNYMDYTDDPCMYFFSDGQVTRADGYLATDDQLLTIQNSSACDAATNRPVTSIENPVHQFSIYPSVTSGKINIQVTTDYTGLAEIRVYNISGANMMNQQITVEQGFNTKQMDLSKLVNGLYIVQLTQNNRRSIQKLVIQH